LKPSLAAFPYTNGGLFAEEIEIPQFTDELKKTLLDNASLDFDWSEISPTIFGAVFESTLNPETRRSGGMHYTSIENIHKVIDPLFFNDLRRELDEILGENVERERKKKLDAYQDKLSKLTFLDPACGSGNFLTETYLSLRRLENEAIIARHHGQSFFGFEEANPIKVSIKQFYGIEINDFAVTVATTALWISEAQMLRETEKIVQHDIVYNNFPWPAVETQNFESLRENIEQTAQAILDARALYPDSSLADLYDELTMPIELRKAHQNNDRAVMQAYGFDSKEYTDDKESLIVAELFKLYNQLSRQQEPEQMR